ncbi:MAG: beta-N-acetylhexosaminidase [Vulcanimicrobiaceae bacterium]
MNDVRRLAEGVICVGFEGTRVDAVLEATMREIPFAGWILFGRNVANVAQTRALTDQIRACAVRPLVAIDQEGGRVMRLRDGIEEIPPMMALAAAGDEVLAEQAGAQIAFDLRRAGVNLDFAPVLDLALFRMNTVIGTRSFGGDPKSVARLGGAFARGMRAGGVAPTYKHFPGHGSTAVDSHTDLPVIDLDEATFRARDLVPFAELLPDAPAVMTAHIMLQSLDPDSPATLSQVILTGLLREEIGFRGVCFTDCLQMDAIAKSVGVARGAVLALAAGADCVLVSHSIALARESAAAIVDAVRDGRLPLARLEEAHQRVAELRGSLAEPLALDAPPPYPGLGREIGRRAVTSIRGSAHLAADASVVVSFEGVTTEGVQGTHAHHPSLAAAATALGLSATAIPEVRVDLDPGEAQIESAIAEIVGSGRNPVVLMRRAHLYRRQAEMVRRLLLRFPDALLVSAREPSDAFEFPQARNVLAVYGDDAPSIEGLAEILYGAAQPSGRLPQETAAAY